MNQMVKKIDLYYLAILIIIAFGIGFYLIVTTVLISKDGVFYIEQAGKFSSGPMEVIKEHSFGYPFLIYIFHRFILLFSDNTAIYNWIYAAQGVSLLCRLLALIPLYYIGKLLVGGRMSFLGLLILIALPYPAKSGSDALRDWPHILFLSTGFLLLLYTARQNKYWMYAAAGIVAGFGFMVRQECVQLILYGSLWLTIGLVPPEQNKNRSALLISLMVLLMCFAVVVTPYVLLRGKILIIPPDKEVSTSQFLESCNVLYSASSIPYSILKVVNDIFKAISENLMYYFVPAWLVAIYFRFIKRGETPRVEKFFIPAVIILNLVILIIVGFDWDYISRRYSLPLLALTIFYVPLGLKFFSDYLERHFSWNLAGISHFHLSWFSLLLLIGIVLCIPKLLKPISYEKSHYRKAALWLAVNTADTEYVAVPDVRISFYANRRAAMYETEIPESVNYAVLLTEDRKNVSLEKRVPGAEKVFSAGAESGISDIEIYDLRGYISDNVSLTGYRWEKIGVEEYVFHFTFKLEYAFKKDWAIYFHLWPEESDLKSDVSQRQSEFENRDFYPEPATSLWPENGYITITRQISVKPVSYYMELGFYRAAEGRYGRRINLGWVDLGKAIHGKGW